MSLITVKNLSVDFIAKNSAMHALKNASLAVKKNEILGIVGESGSGKSTLIKSILRILSAPGLITSGEVFFNNVDILKLNDSELNDIRWKEISFVKQKALNSLNPVKTIGDQLVLPYVFHKSYTKSQATESAYKLLDLVKIDHKYFDSYPHELSGGMRQRIIIAIALALKPKLVIMDEPTTALDVITEREIIKNILELKNELGFSIIFITHDLNLLLQFADKLCVLYDGSIIDSGTTETIKSGGNHEYTKKLLEAIPDINKSIIGTQDLTKNKVYSLKNINVTYQLGSWIVPDDLKAVNNFSIDLYEGSITALIGESGSGKSTIAKIITGLERSQSGELFHFFDNGKQPVVFNMEYRKNIQMIFQDPFSALNSIHTVFHHLKRSYINFNIASSNTIIKEKAIKALEMVDLSPAESFLTKYPHEMSGGECQRVCIARALISKPKIIIADEPTSMLDVSIREEILKLFIRLKDQYSLSVLFITHDIASAAMISDEMVVLKEGSVVDIGSPESIINKSKDKYTKQLIKASTSKVL